MQISNSQMLSFTVDKIAAKRSQCAWNILWHYAIATTFSSTGDVIYLNVCNTIQKYFFPQPYFTNKLVMIIRIFAVEETCGMRPGLNDGTLRIVGGTNARAGEFPWQVSG